MSQAQGASAETPALYRKHKAHMRRLSAFLPLVSLLILAEFQAQRYSRVLAEGIVRADVYNAAQFISALRDESVSTILIKSAELNVTDVEWTEEAVISLKRNLTLQGAMQYPDWPVVRFRAQHKVQLVGDVFLSFTQLVLDLLRIKPDNMLRVPGMDWLAPSPEGSGAVMLLDDVAVVFGVCLPPDMRLANTQASTRPARFPGAQNVTTTLPQTNCINSTTAPLLRRCWSNMGCAVDLAFKGMDPNPTTGVPQPNHYDVLVRNLLNLCEVVVPRECLERQDPISCMLAVGNKVKPSEAADAPPPGGGGGGGDGGGGDGGGGTRVVLPVVLSVGGALVLAAMVALGAVCWRSRRLKAAQGSRKPRSALADSTSSSPAVGSLVPSASEPSKCTAALTDPPADPEPYAEPHLATDPCLSDVQAAMHSGSGPAQQQGSVADGPLSAAAWPGVVTPDTPYGRDLNLKIQIAYESEPTAASSLQAATYESASSVVGMLAGCRAAVGGSSSCGEVRTPAADSDAAIAPVHTVSQEAAYSAPSAPPAAGSCQLGFGALAVAAAAPVPADPEDVVTLLPVVLGKGSFGRVVEGLYRGQRVAVKHLRDEQDAWEIAAAGGRDGGGGTKLLQALTQEVEVLGRCQHPNIVRLIAASVQPPRLGLVMELMETSLDSMMYGQGTDSQVLPLGLALHIATEVARGLEFLHPTIVHRDLKPANVLLNNAASDRPAVKLADFGLSRLRRTVVPTATPGAGTPAYMAPECFDVANNKISHQADVYSFGVLLWEMLMGVRPWARLDAVQVAIRVVVHGDRLPLPPMSFQGQELRWPPKLRRLVQQCWDKDPRRRPAAAEVAKTLALVAQALPPSEVELRLDA